jgi:hypothetical protein
MTQEERDKDMIQKLVQSRIDEQLGPIKQNLDNAYKARDEALQRLAELERKEKEAQLKALEAEGKHKEAAELRLAEAAAKIATLEKQNMELSRDNAVRDALKSYQFRNDKASDMAFKEIVGSLIQDEQGAWKHRSGISIKDFCEAFSKSEEQSFLFKPKTNSGAGSTGGTPPAGAPATKPKSLFEMSQAEVLKLAEEGKLPGQK